MTDTSTVARKPRYTGPVMLGEVEQEDVPSLRKGADLTQYTALIQQSWNLRENEQNSTLGITIVAESRSVVESRLRQAARELGIGVATGVKDNHPGLQPGQLRLLVQARPKRERKPADPNKPKTARKGGKGLPQVGS